MPPRVVLSGYYGFGNVGDDAILQALTAELHAAGAESVLVPAGPLRERLGVLPGVRFCGQRDRHAIAAELRAGAVLLSGGGGLFQDATSLRSLLYYAGVVELARWYRRPWAIVAQSLGPLRRPLARALTGRCLRGARAVSVRDALSQAEAVALGRPGEQVLLSVDPVFALPAPTAAELQQAEEVLPPGPCIALCLRSTNHVETVLQAVAAAALPAEASLVAVACQAADEPVHEALAERLGRPLHCCAAADVRHTLAVLGACELVLAERLHAIIFAVLCGRPVLAVDYDPKVRGLAEQVGVPLAGTDRELSAARLASLADELWSRREQVGADLLDRAAMARQRVRADLRTVFESLA